MSREDALKKAVKIYDAIAGPKTIGDTGSDADRVNTIVAIAKFLMSD